MAGLCWMAVMLTVLLSAGDRADAVNRANSVDRADAVNRANSVNSADAVDLKTLASYVYQIKSMYGTNGMYSLAVSIPLEEKINSLEQVLQGSDPVLNVKNKLDNNEVYVGRRVVAAKLLKPLNGRVQHAESRVVDHLDTLFTKQDNTKQDMLLFYVYASPCDEHCLQTEPPGSILDRINKIRQWHSYAVVFSEVFQPRDPNVQVPYGKRGDALQLLGNHKVNNAKIGLDHVFRCKKPEGSNRMVCIRCDNGNQVAHKCISNENEPGPSQNQLSSQLKQPQQGKGGSSSQRGDSGGWKTVKGKRGNKSNKGR